MRMQYEEIDAKLKLKVSMCMENAPVLVFLRHSQRGWAVKTPEVCGRGVCVEKCKCLKGTFLSDFYEQ
jgi:hypothetical protein